MTKSPANFAFLTLALHSLEGCSHPAPCLQPCPAAQGTAEAINLSTLEKSTRGRSPPPIPGFDPTNATLITLSAPPASSGASPLTLLPPRQQDNHNCAAIEPTNGYSLPTYNPLEDDSALDPDWMELALTIVTNIVCPTQLRRGRHCRPYFVSNKTLENAFFFWDTGTIRYDPGWLSKRSKELKSDDTGKFNKLQVFVLGVIAHEYGHYLDETSGKASNHSARRLLDSGRLHLTEAEWNGLEDTQWEELWGDFVGGCVIQAVDVSPVLMAEYYKGVQASKSTDRPYPKNEHRAIAFTEGWYYCSGNTPPSYLELVFAQFNASMPAIPSQSAAPTISQPSAPLPPSGPTSPPAAAAKPRPASATTTPASPVTATTPHATSHKCQVPGFGSNGCGVSLLIRANGKLTIRVESIKNRDGKELPEEELSASIYDVEARKRVSLMTLLVGTWATYVNNSPARQSIIVNFSTDRFFSRDVVISYHVQ